MRCLLISHDFLPGFPGGISTYYYHISQCLSDTLEVLAPAYGDVDNFDGCQAFQVHRIRVPVYDVAHSDRRRFLHPLRSLIVAVLQLALFGCQAVQLCRVRTYHVILLGHLYLGLLGVPLRRLAGTRYGVALHGAEMARFWRLPFVRRLMLPTLNHADFLIVNSQSTWTSYQERGVRADQRVLLLHPGVDAHRFRPRARGPRPTSGQQQEETGPITLLTVSRLAQHKGHDVVLRALALLQPSSVEWRYRIVGSGSSYDQLKRLTVELGIADWVEFAGHVLDDQLPDCYAEADIFVMPSRTLNSGEVIEGFGISYLEAAASGLPAIAGNVGGSVEAVADGVTGILVNPTDIEEVADAIRRLLHDRTLRLQLGTQARQRAVSEFDWRIQCRRLRKLLLELS